MRKLTLFILLLALAATVSAAEFDAVIVNVEHTSFPLLDSLGGETGEVTTVARVTMEYWFGGEERIEKTFPVFPLSETNIRLSIRNVAYNERRSMLGEPLEVMPELLAEIRSVVDEMDVDGILKPEADR
jgi:hypothetical protein